MLRPNFIISFICGWGWMWPLFQFEKYDIHNNKNTRNLDNICFPFVLVGLKVFSFLG